MQDVRAVNPGQELPPDGQGSAFMPLPELPQLLQITGERLEHLRIQARRG
jgi:hypothetical protein